MKGSAAMARVPQPNATPEEEFADSAGPTFTNEMVDNATEQWDELEPANTDGLTTYRMSSLGGDLSQLVAGALGYEGQMPGYLVKYLQEGRDAEDTIVAMFNEEFAKRDATFPELAELAKAGVIAGYQHEFNEETGTGGPVALLRVGTTSAVKGHADRIVCINPKNERHSFGVVEAKKFRPTLWKVWTAKKTKQDFSAEPTLEKYGWQVSGLFHSTGLPVYFVVGQFDPDTSEIKSIDTLLINENNVPHSKGEIVARVMKAKKHVDAGEVPTCEHADDGCPYAAFDFCPGKPEKEAVDTDDTELGRLLGLYYAYTIDMQQTEEQREADKDRKKVKDQIDKLLEEKEYARTAGDESGLMRVWDDAGNEYEFEWVRYEIAGRGATVGNKVNVKLVIDATAVAPEDHPA